MNADDIINLMPEKIPSRKYTYYALKQGVVKQFDNPTEAAEFSPWNTECVELHPEIFTSENATYAMLIEAFEKSYDDAYCHLPEYIQDALYAEAYRITEDALGVENSPRIFYAALASKIVEMYEELLKIIKK
jgi:hypothetical protein